MSFDVQTTSLFFPIQSLCSFSFPGMCFHQRPAWFSFSLPSAFHSGSPDLEDKRVGSSLFSVPHQFCEQCDESHGGFSFVSYTFCSPHWTVSSGRAVILFCCARNEPYVLHTLEKNFIIDLDSQLRDFFPTS